MHPKLHGMIAYLLELKTCDGEVVGLGFGYAKTLSLFEGTLQHLPHHTQEGNGKLLGGNLLQILYEMKPSSLNFFYLFF